MKLLYSISTNRHVKKNRIYFTVKSQDRPIAFSTPVPLTANGKLRNQVIVLDAKNCGNFKHQVTFECKILTIH